jgi:hypothetical protein
MVVPVVPAALAGPGAITAQVAQEQMRPVLLATEATAHREALVVAEAMAAVGEEAQV